MVVNIEQWCKNLQLKIYNNTDFWKEKSRLEKILNLLSIEDKFIGKYVGVEECKYILKEIFNIENIESNMFFGTYDNEKELKSLCFFHPSTNYKNSVIFCLNPEERKFNVTIPEEMFGDQKRISKVVDPKN